MTLTQSAAAVCGVAFCASVAVSTKEATERTVRLTRIVITILIVEAHHNKTSNLYQLISMCHKELSM